jgi:hypothetical protein
MFELEFASKQVVKQYQLLLHNPSSPPPPTAAPSLRVRGMRAAVRGQQGSFMRALLPPGAKVEESPGESFVWRADEA